MKKIFLVLFCFLIFPDMSRGDEIVNSTTVRFPDPEKNKGVLSISSAPRFYEKYNMEWDTLSSAVYSRDIRTDDGYKYGIWRNKYIWEIPDSLNSDLVFKLRDRFNGNALLIKPIGIVRYLNKEVDKGNIVDFKNPSAVAIDGNEASYGFGSGSKISLFYNEGTVKQKIHLSEIDRRALIQYIPRADYVGILYQYEKQGSQFDFGVDVGQAWTEDSTFYKVYDKFEEYNNKHYWVSGVTFNVLNDTLEHPGYIVIDPVVQITPGTLDRWISPGVNATNTNLGARSLLADTITTLLKFPILGLPENSTVISAVGSLYVHTKSSNITTYSSGLLVAFDESATWLTTDGVTTWDRPGAYTVGTDILQFTDTTAITSVGWTSWDLTTYIKDVAGVDSTHVNYGITIGSLRDQDYGDGVFFGSPTYATTTQRPILYVEYSLLINNVYVPDSLALSSITDSSAVLDSIAGNSLDSGTANYYAIYDTTRGMYVAISATEPYTRTMTLNKKALWNAGGLVLPMARDYVHKFLVMAFAPNQVDSMKYALYSATIGTPSTGSGDGTNEGRWDPLTDKIH